MITERSQMKICGLSFFFVYFPISHKKLKNA